MNWQDKGYLLSKNKYNENSIIAEFFTENHGKVTGVIFGATSKKIKNYLLIGNKFHLNINSKQEDKIGYFKVEIDKFFTPFFLENKKKLYCIIYAMNILKILTVENQQNKNIFFLINNFFSLLNEDNWIVNFIFWELELFKNLGYDLNFSNYVKNINISGEQKFIVLSSNKTVPNFLVNKVVSSNKNDVLDGFKIVGDFLDKTILRPNNISYPITRYEFINLIK